MAEKTGKRSKGKPRTRAASGAASKGKKISQQHKGGGDEGSAQAEP